MEAVSTFQKHIGSFEIALKIVNDLYWNISIQQKDDKWLLWGGEAFIGAFESKSELESFILGMALAIGVLPPEIIAEIRKLVE